MVFFFWARGTKTLNVAEHPSSRHNTTSARQPPPKLPDTLALAPKVFVWQDGQVPPLQPLYDENYAIRRRSLHHFTLRIGDKEDRVSTLQLKPCSDPTAPPAQPRTRACPPTTVRIRDFRPQGTLCPATRKGTSLGTIFPWPAARGFCMPHRRSSSRHRGRPTD